MKKRMFAMLICLVMLLAALPVSVRAATEISVITLNGFKEPAAGASVQNFLVLTTGQDGIGFYSIDWYDETDKAFLEGSDTFREGHIYSVQIWVEAMDGYYFRCINDSTPDVTATLDGRTLTVTKAYEYKAFAMVVLNYTFDAVTGETQPAHTHTPSDWRITGAYHYTVCTECGEFLMQEDHTGGVATCTEKGKCTVCGCEYLETTEDHIPDTSEWIARTDMYHFHPCKLCGAHCDIEDHRWSPKPHVTTASGHAYQCADCMACSEEQPHIPGPAATETAPQTCTECGYILAPAKNHVHDLAKVPEVPADCIQEGNIEYYVCAGCMDCFTDPEGKNKIPETQSVMTPALGHTVSDDWKRDENYHWRVCAVCGEVLEETRMVHEQENGKCATCGYGTAGLSGQKEPEEQNRPAEDEGGAAAFFAEFFGGSGLGKWLIVLWLGLVCFGGAVTATVIILKKNKEKAR